MKALGIFLGYAPEQTLRNQGIGRLLAALLTQWSGQTNLRIVIACPLWYRTIVEDLVREYGIPATRVELLTTPSIPAVVTLKTRWDAWRRRTRRPRRWKQMLREWSPRLVRSIGAWIFASMTMWSFALRVLLATPLILLAAPLLMVVWFMRGVGRFARALATGRFEKVRRVVALANAPLATLKNSGFANFVYESARATEFARLVDIINSRDDIDVWYVPAMFWPEVRGIRAPTVMAAPDIVHSDFPTRFNEPNQLAALHRVVDCATHATHLVCYSEYVRDRQLSNLGVERSRCTVIHHGYDGIGELRDIVPATADPEVLRHYCAGVLRDFQAQNLYVHHYLADFDFSSTRYFFYSSQMRPHKNHLALLEAFEFNLRKKYVNAKLILTCSALSEREVAAFYASRRMSYDVIMLHNVSNDVLNALNCLAVCAVNPSLFEGGFPFTFAEAYSMGTPSIMGAIPVTMEQVRDPELRRIMLFDPHSVSDMADRMNFAFHCRDELYTAQAPFFRDLVQRTWAVAAEDYLDLFRSVARRPASRSEASA